MDRPILHYSYSFSHPHAVTYGHNGLTFTPSHETLQDTMTDTKTTSPPNAYGITANLTDAECERIAEAVKKGKKPIRISDIEVGQRFSPVTQLDKTYTRVEVAGWLSLKYGPNNVRYPAMISELHLVCHFDNDVKVVRR